MFKNLMVRLALVSAVSAPALALAAPYTVLVTDRTDQVHAYSSSGTELSPAQFTAPAIPGAWGVAADSVNQKIFVGNINNGTITRLNANGSLDTTFSLTNGITSASFVYGMDVGADGNLYAIGDTTQLWKVNTSTLAVTLLTSSLSGVSYQDVASNTDGDVYVSEIPNGRVSKWNSTTGAPDGYAVTYVDGQTAPQVDAPHAIDIDANGHLVVLDLDRFPTPGPPDSTNHWLIRHFQLSPTVDLGTTWTADTDSLGLHFGVKVAPDGRTFFTSYNPGNTYGVGVFDTLGNASSFATLVNQSIHVDFLVTPEPASASLLGLGAMMLLRRRRVLR